MNDRDMVAMANDAQYEDALASDKPVRFESEGYGCTALVQNVRVGETVVAQVVTNDLVARSPRGTRRSSTTWAARSRACSRTTSCPRS